MSLSTGGTGIISPLKANKSSLHLWHVSLASVCTLQPFDKLHVLYLRSILQFCDLTQEFRQRSSSLPLSRTMEISNDLYSTLTPSPRLSSHTPFTCSHKEIERRSLGKTMLYSVTFLWVCEMVFFGERARSGSTATMCPTI